MRFKKEILRKLLHLPGILFLFEPFSHVLIAGCVLGTFAFLYLFSWGLKKTGYAGLPLVSALTERLKRSGSLDLGPLFLGVGIFLALLFFEAPHKTMAIAQICISDGFAATVGIYAGKTHLFYSPKKTYLGSFAFGVSAFLIGLACFGPVESLVLALLGTFLESLPFGSFDNVLVPVGLGFLSSIFLG